MAAPLPQPDTDSGPFWSGCRDGVLKAQRCGTCDRFRWPPMEFCPHCHAHGGAWTALSGVGTVRSFVIVERAFDPAFSDKVPYVIANVALDDADGVVMLANVVTNPPESVAVGQIVTVAFEEVGDVLLPRFHPIAST